MAIDEGVTEVADSDEELMTSSPFLGADDAADKLPAMASGQPQELQDATQNLDSTLQALGQDDAKSAPQGTAALVADRCGASIDFNAPAVDQTDVKLEGAAALKEERAIPQISDPDLGMHAQINSPGVVPRTIHGPVANSSMRQLLSLPGQTQSCTAAQPLDSSSAPQDACSKSTEDMINRCDPEAHDGQTHAEPSHVVRKGSSQSTTMSEDIRQDASEYSDIIYPTENAVHRSQAMGISDTTWTLAPAVTNASPPTTLSLTGSVSNPVASKEGIDVHPSPQANETGGQKLQMNGVDRTPDVTFQEPVAGAQEASSFTPHVRTVLEKPQVRSLPLQKAPQPNEASQGLHTGDTATEVTCESQRQPSIRASPTTMLTASSKTPQETTLSELKAQKAALLASLRSLPAIQVLMEEVASSETGDDGGCAEPTDADVMNAANKIVKQHIKLLHEYNELKDVGQGLMGLIADQRGVRIVEVQEEFGVDAKD